MIIIKQNGGKSLCFSKHLQMGLPRCHLTVCSHIMGQILRHIVRCAVKINNGMMPLLFIADCQPLGQFFGLFMQRQIKFQQPLKLHCIYLRILLHKLPQNIAQTNFRLILIMAIVPNPILGQLLKEGKGTVIQWHQIVQHMQKFTAVIIGFHHFFHIFQPQRIGIWQGVGGQHLVRGSILIYNGKVLPPLMNHRTFQHF